LQSFRSIANLCISQWTIPPPPRNAIISRIPSTLGIIRCFIEDIEQPSIHFVIYSRTPTDFTIFIRKTEIGITLIRFIRIVNIRIAWIISLLAIEENKSHEGEPIIIEDIEISEHASNKFHYSNLHIGEANQFSGDQMISLGISGHSFHNIEFPILISQCDSWSHISSNTDNQHENR
jgi:hypothetical protein